MIYYEKRDGKLCKMECTYDSSKLDELKTKIILNCSMNEYHEHNCTKSYLNDLVFQAKTLAYVTELDAKFNGYYEYEQGPDVPRYFVKYYKLKEPKLVSIIDKFIKEDPSAIKELNEYKIEEAPSEIIKLKIESLSAKIDKVPNEKYERKINALTILGELYKQLDKNINAKSTKEYYNKLKELISIRQLNSFDYENVIDFFGEDRVSKLILK